MSRAMAPFAGTAGLILAGGRSSRLGRDKARLRFGAETLLERAVRRMRAVAEPVLVAAPVAAGGARAWSVPEGAIAVPDPSPHEGPLVGMAAGFRHLAASADGTVSRVLLMPVDVPFFTEPWLARLAEGLSRAPAVLYRYQGIANALAAGYRLELLPKLERLIAAGERSAKALAAGEPVLVLTIEELWRPSEGPPPLLDLDCAEDYRDALRWEGFGDAFGVPLWVRWGAHEAAAAYEDALPLWARTAAQALEFAAGAHPERSSLVRAARERPSARILRTGSPAEVSWDAALWPEDTVLCEA